MKNSSGSNQESLEEISSLQQKIKDLEKDLSDRVHANEALRKSEEKYRILVENASEAIFVAQGEKLVFVNMAASRYTGYTAQELMSQPFIEFIYPDDRAMVMRCHIDRLNGETVPATYAFRVIRKDGRVLWGELQGILIDWEGERATLNFMTDISERRSAEEALHESESTQRALLANLPVGVIIIDPLSRTIEEVNNTAAEMFGAAPEHIIGHCCHAFLCPANEGACPVCDLGQEVDSSDRQMIRADGSIHPVLKSVKRVKIKGQEKLLECFIDITDRAKAERELKNAHSQLERVLKFDEALLSAIPTPVFYKDREGRYLGCNRAFTEIMGVTSDQIKGKTVMELWPGEHAAMYHKKDLELMQNPARQVYEFMVHDKDGKDRMVIFAKDIFLDESGQAAGIVGAFLDITERKQAEMALMDEATRRRILVEQSGDGIVVLDQEGRVYESNQKFADMLGYSLAEMSTLTVFDWEFLVPRERIVEMIRTVDEKGAHFETRHRRKDGSHYDVEISTNAALFAGQKLIFCVCRDISQRLEAEEALRVSEERFRTFFNLPIVGFAITDTDGAWIHFNDKLSEMLGYSRDELMLKTWMELTPSEDLIKERNLFVQVVKGAKNTSNIEKRYIRKDGSLLDVFISTQVVRSADGSVAYFASIIQDISDRKRDEENRRLNAQRTEALLHLNQMATAPFKEITDFVLEEAVRLTKSTIGYLAFLNDDESVLTMHSWSKTAMNQCAMEQKPIHYPVRETGLWGEAVRQRKPIITNDYGAPNPLKKGYPAGHVRIARHMNVPVFGESKIVLVAGVGNKEEEYDTADVQQLTLLMEGMWRLIEHRRSSEAILMEREKLKTLSDNAPFGMVLVDREGRFTYMNAKFTVLFGYTPSDIPDGKTWFRKAYPDTGYRHNVIATWLDDLGDRNPGQRKPRVFTVTCKNGVQKIINFIPAVLVSGDYLMTCEDITELRRLENQLRQAQKMEAIGTLAGGVAHDFNNILTVMTGYAALMQIQLDISHPVRPYVDQILLASKKAADLTRSLLAFSRKQSITLVPLDITSTIQETEKLLRRLLTEDIELRTSFTEDNMIVMADKSQIDQILFNLVTNARDAMPAGGTLTITTSLAIIDGGFIAAHGFGNYGRYVRMSVSDTGTGMDTKTLQSIFEPFFTTKETGKGTGLGLATVYGIVKQHNGYITVDSALNRGTVFHVYLPEVQGKVDKTQDIATPLQRGKETVLIAEDNEGVRVFMRDVLQQHGYKILEAVDGEDAIDAFVQHRGVDLVILDSVMPKKNGREVYEAIRAINPYIKVLFTSGYTKDIILDKGIGEKEFDFIAKPLLPDTLLRKVREVLDRT